MNKHALVCRSILENAKITQRELSVILDSSLGTTNRLVKECLDQGLIREENHSYSVTDAGLSFLAPYKVDGAVIIAAGFGSRFVPLTFEMPKGLLEVFGERMIERQIKQLHEVGIYDITIVVGYLKEKFEYLIDKYQVNLLYNREYSTKNTLTTIYHARKLFEDKNMYILSSDNWMRQNMYHTYECGSWYSSVFQEGNTSEWCLSYNKKGIIKGVSVGGRDSWVMYGPVFLRKEWTAAFLPVLSAYYTLPGTEQFYWETVYLEILNGLAAARLKTSGLSLQDFPGADPENPDMALYINRQPSDQVYEFENLEELRLFDTSYQNHSNNQAMELISRIMQIPESEIINIKCLKSGMTNKSFLFSVAGKRYICRIPGPGTGLLINRRQEHAVFEAIKPLGISEHVLYFDPESGYKISEFYEGSRNADAFSKEDLEKCMALLHQVHESGVTVSHTFDIRERIQFYENLCIQHRGTLFEDYTEIRTKMNHLMDHLDDLHRPMTLSHIDSVADNFLFLPDGTIRLIDWEYAGMCDPLIDIAMCAIYSYFDETQTDDLIHTYFHREPTEEERTVIYSYVALGGFLWSLWAIYKASLGEEFGEYTIIQYRYAKKYAKKLGL